METVVENKMENGNVDWEHVQRWLQEAGMILDYCTRLAIAKRTGDVDTAMGGNTCFLMQFDLNDKDADEARIRRYVANIGKMAEAGWKTNENFPFFGCVD